MEILFRSIQATLSLSILLSTSNALAKEMTCKMGTLTTKCTAYQKSDKIGGFQAAPIFTLESRWKTIDHRGYVYKILKGDGYTTFHPAGKMLGTSLTVYGLHIQ